MRLRDLCLAALTLLTLTANAAPNWETLGGKREIHFRIVSDNMAMLDIACSSSMRVLLGASFISTQSGFTRDFALLIDGRPTPNYLNPNAPPGSKAEYYKFWNAFKNAKAITVKTSGRIYEFPVTGLKEQLPETYDVDFTCRPINTNGLLIP